MSPLLLTYRPSRLVVSHLSSKWLTRRATEELTPGIWASTTVAFFVLVEFCEACGTLGAHVPFWTVGSFAAVFLLKMVYHNAAMFLE